MSKVGSVAVRKVVSSLETSQPGRAGNSWWTVSQLVYSVRNYIDSVRVCSHVGR